MHTWKDIKLTTLQKMFAAEGSSIPNDESTRDYIASMPAAANEALQLLSTAGKFIVKSITIAHNPVKNLLSDSEIHAQERGTMTFESDLVRSIYFECFGVGTYEVYVGDTLFASGELSNSESYGEHRVLVTNVNDEHVSLKIMSDYPLAVKNVALYSANFATESDIQSYAEYIRYNLKDLASDFYMLSVDDVYFEGSLNRYVQTQSFFQEGNKVLVLNRDVPGNYTIYYYAYPTKITTTTSDDYELPIDDEVAVLMPLYMASQIYKDDDNGIATSYRNEFEVAFERLRNRADTQVNEQITSESGWC